MLAPLTTADLFQAVRDLQKKPDIFPEGLQGIFDSGVQTEGVTPEIGNHPGLKPLCYNEILRRTNDTFYLTTNMETKEHALSVIFEVMTLSNKLSAEEQKTFRAANKHASNMINALMFAP